MSVIAVARDQIAHEHPVHEIHVDLRELRSWGTGHHVAAALEALTAVRMSLVSFGISDRSAARIASALARYAFLTEGGCNPSRHLLWRLYSVDGVPPDVLAQLTWDQVRVRLREIAVPTGSATRYFPLSDQTCRLLRAARIEGREARGSAHVCVTQEGQAWHPELLSHVLAAISVR